MSTSWVKTWDEVIDDAEYRGWFTYDEYREAATMWATCAVGECLSTRAQLKTTKLRGDKDGEGAAFDRVTAFMDLLRGNRSGADLIHAGTTFVLQFVGSLTLCDHMGDVSNDVLDVLKRLGFGDIKWDDMNDLGRWLGSRGITTLLGTSLRDEEPTE